MVIKQKFSTLVAKLRVLPKRYMTITSVLVIGGILYTAAFIIEKPVLFSYADRRALSDSLYYLTFRRVALRWATKPRRQIILKLEAGHLLHGQFALAQLKHQKRVSQK